MADDLELGVEPPEVLRPAVSAFDKARVDKALEVTRGNLDHAAKILGMPKAEVKELIAANRELSSRWAPESHPVHRPVPPDVAAIDQPPPTQPAPARETALVEALARQDALLSAGWEKLGFDTKQRDFLKTLQATYSGSAASVMHLMGAGVAHTYTRLLFVFEELVRRIEEIDANPDAWIRMMRGDGGMTFERKGPHEYRCELYDRLVAVAGELRKVTGDVQKIQLMRAQIDRLKQDDEKKKARKRQGWGPPPVAVEATVTTPDEGAV